MWTQSENAEFFQGYPHSFHLNIFFYSNITIFLPMRYQLKFSDVHPLQIVKIL